MKIAPGQDILHYQLIQKIGEGGMGVVWKARDTKLKRDVAIKFLPARLIGDRERRHRLIREARAAAAISHPNIATVYEVGELDEQPFIVMEMVQGSTLRSRIRAGAMPVADSLAIACDTVDGLRSAHRARIVHRDLKPENVMIDSDDHVRLLDFGLAKATEPDGTSEASLGQSGTTEVHTLEGRVFGTPGYMSPEQARGQPVDSRSDVFSFGVMFYEMVTGTHPFEGATPVDVLTAVIRSEPAAPSKLNSEVSPELDRIVGKCLQKRPDERYQETGDLLADLRKLKRATDGQAVALGGGAERGARLGAGAVLFAMVAMATMTFLAVRFWPNSSARDGGLPEISQRLLTTNTVDNLIGAAMISPDGKYLAYGESPGLFVKILETGELKELTPILGTDDVIPSGWFPNSNHLAVTVGPGGSDPSLCSISVITGAVQKLRGSASGLYCGSAVSPDGETIAYAPKEADRDQIWLMNSDGSNPRCVVKSESDAEIVNWWVAWSPKSTRIAYRRMTRLAEGFANSIETCNLDGEERRVVLPFLPHVYPGLHAVWVPDGRIVFSRTDSAEHLRENNLWAIEMDLGTGKARGEPKRLTSWVDGYSWFLTCTTSGEISLVRWQEQVETMLATVREDPLRLENVRQATSDALDDIPGAWMPDSRGLLVSSNRRGSADIFHLDIESRAFVPVVTGPAQDYVEALSPDGQWILYRVRSEQSPVASVVPSALMRVPVAGGSPVEVGSLGVWDGILCGRGAGSRCVYVETVLDRFRFLRPPKGSNSKIYWFDSGGGRGELIIEVEGWIESCDLSPDATQLAWLIENAETPAHVEVLNLDSGARRKIRLDREGQIRELSWNASSDCLYAITQETGSMVRITLDGDTTVFQEETDGIRGGTDLLPSPDGGMLAFAGSRTQNSVWLLSGY